MAALHSLTFDKGFVRVVYHVQVPDEQTQGPMSLRTAVARSGEGGRTVLVDGDGTEGTISAAEKASLVAGAVWEVVRDIALPNEWSSMSRADQEALATTSAANVAAESVDMLRTRFAYFGFVQG